MPVLIHTAVCLDIALERVRHLSLERSGIVDVAENSHSMGEIEGPDSGMTVSYLKDILDQAKLYIRPLQRDIKEDMKPYSIPEVRNVGLHPPDIGYCVR